MVDVSSGTVRPFESPNDAFTGLAHAYSRSRPSYPDQCLDVIEAHLVDLKGRQIALDVGCGTGIFTRQLGSRFEQLEIIGIDPNEEMLVRARNDTTNPNVAYARLSAEDIPKEMGPFCLITAASSANWFNREVFYRLAESHLNDGGILAILVNIRNSERGTFMDDIELYLEDVIPGYVRGHYSSHEGIYVSAPEYSQEISHISGFYKPKVMEFTRKLTFTQPRALDYFFSFNDIKRACHFAGGKNSVGQKLRQLMTQHFSTDGAVSIPVISRITFAAKRPIRS